MKVTLLLALASSPFFAAALWHGYKEPKVEVQIEERLVEPEKVEAAVELTKWQLEKMLSHYEEDAHPSDLQRFRSVVKRQPDGSWRISSTHLAKGAEQYPLPSGKFYVIDASYIDHHGDFKSCIDYAHSYKDHHEYIVVSPK